MENTISKNDLNNWMPYLMEEIRSFTTYDEFKLDTAIQVEELNPDLQLLKEEDFSFLFIEEFDAAEVTNDDVVFNPFTVKSLQVEAAAVSWMRIKKRLKRWLRKVFCTIVGDSGVYTIDQLIEKLFIAIMDYLPGGKVFKVLLTWLNKQIAKLIRGGYNKVCPA